MIGGNLAFEMGYGQLSNQILDWKFPLAQGQVWGKVQGMFWEKVWEWFREWFGEWFRNGLFIILFKKLTYFTKQNNRCLDLDDV